MSSAADAEKRASRASLGALRSVLPYALAHKGRIAAALVALFIASAATLVVPIAVRQMIDFGFSDANGGVIRSLFHRHAGRRRRARDRLGRALLLRHDARRAGGGGPSLRPLRPSHPPRSRLFRRREDRRDRLAPLRRHDPAQGDLRLDGVDRAAQSLHVRRRDRDDGRDQRQALGLRARRDPDHRPAAVRRGPGGAPAFAPRPGYARRRHRLRDREPLGGARHAVVHRRSLHRQPLPGGRLRRLRGGAQHVAGARDRHRGRPVPGLRQRRRSCCGSAPRTWWPDASPAAC